MSSYEQKQERKTKGVDERFQWQSLLVLGFGDDILHTIRFALMG
jgi:hypothetical protein